MSYTYDDIEQITVFLNKQSGGVGNIYAHAANMLEELAKDRARLEQRVKDLEDQLKFEREK